MTKISLSSQGLKRLRTAHPWVFRNDLLGEGSAEHGSIVELTDGEGRFKAFGFYSATSKIAVRIFSWSEEGQESSKDRFWKERLRRSIERRKSFQPYTTGVRLVFGESDGFPGLIVDQYGDHLVLQILHPAVEARREMILEELESICEPACIVERSDSPARKHEDLPERVEVLRGELASPVLFQEGDLQLEVDLMTGQKTGSFLDQRDNHLRAGELASGRAADVFCYHGGFALQMARKAKEVIAVDSSEAALEVGRRNAERNKLPNITWEKAKAADWLRSQAAAVAEGSAEPFDIVSIDPPAFAKSARDLESAVRGYRELNLRAMRLVRPGGLLISSSCSYHLSEEDFVRMLRQAAAESRRRVRVLEHRPVAADHAGLLTLPESFYLKCSILQVDVG